VPDDVPQSRLPTPAELKIIRERLDPDAVREKEIR
jgi:hypothetical protein